MADFRVAVIMGSDSDWSTMEPAATVVSDAGIHVAAEVVSAHRTPEKMFSFARSAQSDGFGVIIAGAGAAAHLPGMVASLTPLPVIGVPVSRQPLDGMDSLLSIVQMPSGVPVATVGIDQAKNAGILALQILALSNPDVSQFLRDLMATQTSESLAKSVGSAQNG